MAEPVTFITWCTDASPPPNARNYLAPAVIVHSCANPPTLSDPPANLVAPKPAPADSVARSIPILWPGPVQFAVAVFILAAAASLAYQSFRTAPPGAELYAGPIELIDLNLASEAELRLLPGIGPNLAQRIVERRQTIGKFRSVDELRSVQGIGPVTLARLRLRVVVDDAEPDDPGPRVAAAKPKAARMTKTEIAKGNEIIDVNRASAAELRKIPGIGPVLSNNIVNYRTEKGPFRAVEDLCKVSGIKSKTLEKIKPFITLNAEHQAQAVAP